MRHCIICGAAYEPYYASAKRQKMCGSKECLKEYMRLYHKERYSSSPESERINQRIRYRKTSHVICRICGKPIIRDASPHVRWSNSIMHEECIFKDCLKTLSEGNKLEGKQLQRLYTHGWNADDVKRAFEKGISNDEKVCDMRKGV